MSNNVSATMCPRLPVPLGNNVTLMNIQKLSQQQLGVRITFSRI